jgi:acid stress-induced BolA-like protein IbaG/YrbA
MPKVARIPAFVSHLLSALVSKFPDAVTDVEKLPGLDMPSYRLAIVSEAFKDMDQWARQNVVWDIADEILTSDQRLRVVSILVLTPEELEEQEEA